MLKNLFKIIILTCLGTYLHSQSIVNTPHNLSVSSSSKIKATSEVEICLFCHTPHNSRPIAPLWNRKDPGSNYTLYNSPTLQALPGQPDGNSILCLSCHDGTIALGDLYNQKSVIDFGAYSKLPSGKSNLSTDLRNDHPISFVYSSSLSTSDGEIKDPSTLSLNVKLENSKLQCTSCHDPHDNSNENFLVETNKYSNLCLSCHTKYYWENSSHKNSNSTWNGINPNPWDNLQYNTVSENGCDNCHNSHNSGSNNLLLKNKNEEDNCFNCHNGNVAKTNIQAQFAKMYKHNVSLYLGNHDASENTLVNSRHVECEDCHNSHATSSLASEAPNVKGANLGVKGINQNGTPVNNAQYEYEICYRCHADSPDKPISSISRVIQQDNVRLEFAISNPSHHAVTGMGTNSNVPSLISPLTTSSVIYCSDCHASNGAGSPTGPHGSIYPQILKYQYVKTDNTYESYSNYELCYSCHDRNSIINNIGGNNTFKEHKKHIIDERTPCSVCHDSHGISSLQGNSTNNSHLINFNTAVVSSYNGELNFYDGAPDNRYCLLKCHGKNHNSDMNY